MEILTRTERRTRRRFELPLTVQFRLSRKGSTSRWSTGTIRDMSSNGISFRSREPLPLGCHLEVNIAWPATRSGQYTTQFRATGLVVRNSGTTTAMSITWHQLQIAPAAEMSLSAIA